MNKKEDQTLINPTVRVRGFSPDIEEWVSYLAPYINNEPVILSEDDNHKSVTIHQVLPDTVMNSTGKYDMNGREMFTGDAIRIDYLGLYYIYSSDTRKIEIAPLTYRSEGKSFSDIRKMTLDLNKTDELPAIEVIGNTTMQTLHVHMDEWMSKRRRKELEIKEINPELVPEEDDEILTEEYEEWEEIADPDDWEEYDDDELEEMEGEWEEELEAAEEDMKKQEITEFVSTPNINEEHLPEEPVFKGKSLDMETWFHGLVVYDHDEGEAKFIYENDGKSYKVHDILPGTICRSTSYKDMAGDRIYTKDILLVNNDTIMVIDFVPEAGDIKVIRYNMYESPDGNNPDKWSHIVHETWVKYPQVLKIIGNTIDGISPDWLPILESAVQSGTVISGYGELPENDKNVSDKSSDPIYILANHIENLVYAVNRNVKGFYIDDFSSDYKDMVLQCRWKLRDGYELHVYYNSTSGVNSCYFGKWDFSPDYNSSHGLVSQSDRMSAILEAMTHITLDEVDYENLVDVSIKDNPNPIKIDALKLKYDNIIKKRFDDADSISHTEFEQVMRSLFPTKKSLESSEYRAMDTDGHWITGTLQNIDETANILYNPEEDYEAMYLVSSLSPNTFLADKNDRFIFSGDVVNYEGKGVFIVYSSAEIDPTDIVNPVLNETGQRFIYCMEYTGFQNMFKLKWKMISISEWIRNRSKIEIIGNMTETVVTDKNICYNSDNLEHDEDPMKVTHTSAEIKKVSRSNDNRFWVRYYDDTIEVEDEISWAKSKFFPGAGDEHLNWRCMHLSDENRTPVKTLSLYNGQTEIRLMWMVPSNITLMFALHDNFTRSMNVVKYAESIESVIESMISIMTNDRKNYQLLYNFEFTMPEPPVLDRYEEMKKEVAAGNLTFPNQRQYMKYVRKELFRDNEADFNSCQCRAMTEFGRWIMGCLSPDGEYIYPGGREDCKTRYVRETLGFNTYLIDASKRYIYDNDIVLVRNMTANSLFLIEREPYLKNVDDLSIAAMGDARKDILNKNIYRCVWSVWQDAFGEDSLTDVDFVPIGHDWFIRNIDRVLCIGDTFTNNIETDIIDI